jgi:hypothetical protein
MWFIRPQKRVFNRIVFKTKSLAQHGLRVIILQWRLVYSIKNRAKYKWTQLRINLSFPILITAFFFLHTRDLFDSKEVCREFALLVMRDYLLAKCDIQKSYLHQITHAFLTFSTGCDCPKWPSIIENSYDSSSFRWA